MPSQQATGADPPIVIVGAGLAGSLLACYFGRAGRPVHIYEKRPDPRLGPAERGRSINLALSVRGIHALRDIGLADEVLTQGVLMRGRMIHDQGGRLTFQRYGKDDTEALHSVSRAGLNRLLVEAAARHPSVRFVFGQRCHGLAGDGVGVEFVDAPSPPSPLPLDGERGKSAPSPLRVDGSPPSPLPLEGERGRGEGVVTVPASAIIGADGAYSAVRAWMQKREGFNYQQDYLTHGYKELTIPAGPDGNFLMEKHALHIWPRGEFMMIALPNQGGSFTCTLFWPFEGPNSFAALTSEADVLAFFREQFPDAVPLLPHLAQEFLRNPTGALVTIRCQPWRAGRAVLVGDACHAVVPFLGQGMNAAFEDCTVLVKCLEETAWNWTAAAKQYEALRKVHTDTLADLCVENFIEMRDRVASPWFLFKKRLAVLLHALFPRLYLPLYTMIEFTRIPYADAARRARRQNWVALGIAALVGIVVALACVFFLRG